MRTLGNGVTNESVGCGVVAGGDTGAFVTRVDGATEGDGAVVTISELPGAEHPPTIIAHRAIRRHHMTPS